MKFIDEYRDGAVARQLSDAIARTVTRPWTIMEVCGGQTHTIVKYGVDCLLPPQVELVHGRGCPMCVTSLGTIDRAHAIASRPEVEFEWKIPKWSNAIERNRARSYFQAYSAAAALYFAEQAMQELYAGRTRTFTEFKVPEEAIGCGFHEAVRGVLSQHFRLTDADWEALHLPINLAFFVHSTPAGRVVALYPSPAGPTESLMTLDAWQRLVDENPILRHADA